MACAASRARLAAVSRRHRGDGSDLDGRLEALADAVDAAEGVLSEAHLGAARALLARAGERLGHGVGHTVVALAGATARMTTFLEEAADPRFLAAPEAAAQRR